MFSRQFQQHKYTHTNCYCRSTTRVDMSKKYLVVLPFLLLIDSVSGLVVKAQNFRKMDSMLVIHGAFQTEEAALDLMICAVRQVKRTQI